MQSIWHDIIYAPIYDDEITEETIKALNNIVPDEEFSEYETISELSIMLVTYKAKR